VTSNSANADGNKTDVVHSCAVTNVDWVRQHPDPRFQHCFDHPRLAWKDTPGPKWNRQNPWDRRISHLNGKSNPTTGKLGPIINAVHSLQSFTFTDKVDAKHNFSREEHNPIARFEGLGGNYTCSGGKIFVFMMCLKQIFLVTIRFGGIASECPPWLRAWRNTGPSQRHPNSETKHQPSIARQVMNIL